MSAVSAHNKFDDAMCLFVDSNDQSVVPGAIELLIKIVKNILQHPHDEKFRKLKANNKLLSSKILCLHNGEFLFLQAGFIKVNDEYVLHPDEFLYDYLVFISSKLEKFMDRINGLTRDHIKESSSDKAIIADDTSLLVMQQILQFIQHSKSNDSDPNSGNDK